MATSPNPVQVSKPFSLAHARSTFARTDPKGLAMMTHLMPWDYFHQQYEFHEVTLNPDWTATNSGGAGASSFVLNTQRNAALRGATGTTSTGTITLYYASALFDPSDNPFFWLRWVAPAAVTSFAFEIGFANVRTDQTLASVSAMSATPTPTIGNGSTDIAVATMDTSNTFTTAVIAADGTTGTPLATSLVNRAGLAWTPTASGIIDTIVGIRPNLTFCWIWDSLAPMGVMQSVAQGPDAGVLQRPYALFKTQNTTGKTVDLLKAILVSEEQRTT